MAQRQTNRQKAEALAAELGVTIDSFWTGVTRGVNGGDWCVSWDVEAPEGMVWTATGSHTLTIDWSAERGHPEAKASHWWPFLIKDLEAGVSPCPDRPTCDWCDDGWWEN